MRRRGLSLGLGWVLGWIGFISIASANVGQEYGFGARTGALGGAGVAWGFDAFAAYDNPAGLSLEKEKRLLLNWGLLYMDPTFFPINNVVTQNSFNADNAPGSPTYGNVDMSYQPTFGQEIGLSYRLFPEFLNLTVGFVSFLPVNQIAYIDTGEAYIPEYIMYRARTQRPQFELGAGVDFGSGIHFGAGLHVGYTLTGNATVFINTQPGTISSMRFVSSLKPKVAPYFGLLYTPESNPKNYSFGAVFRFPLASDNELVLNSSARVFGDFAAVDFNFNALSILYYDPMALELGGTWQYLSWSRLYAQLDYQLWKQYQPSALFIEQPQTSQCPSGGGTCGTVQINGGSVPTYSYNNILVPRLADEVQVTEVSTFRAGYAYRPTILSELPTGPGNFLDPSKHIFTIGWGLRYEHFLGFDTPCRLDFNLAYHRLIPEHITKTPGNEVGNTQDQKIGSPGYDVGGNIFGGGVSLLLAI